VFLAIADDFYDRLEMAIAGLTRACRPIRPTAAPFFQLPSLVRVLPCLHRLAATVMLKEAPPSITVRSGIADSGNRHIRISRSASAFSGWASSPSLSPDIVAHLQVGMFEELVKAFVCEHRASGHRQPADQDGGFRVNGAAVGRLIIQEDVCACLFLPSGSDRPARAAQSAPVFPAARQRGDKVRHGHDDRRRGEPLTSPSANGLAINGHVCTGARPEDREGWRSDLGRNAHR
jgi:hypothetical protein